MELQNMHMLRSLVHSLFREVGTGSVSTGWFIIPSIPTHLQHSLALQTQNGSNKHP